MILKLLAALGIAAILIVLLVVVGFFVLRHKFRKFVKGLGSLAGPPSEVTLVPAETLAWKDASGAARAASALQARRFYPAGKWTIAEIPGMCVDAYAHEEEGAWGVVCEHPEGGLWIDLYTEHADGTSITFSNSPNAGVLDQMPGRAKVTEPGADPEKLLARFFAERPAVARKEHLVGAFKAEFERAYREEMEWRDARGGATEDEVERIAERMDEDVSPEAIKRTAELFRGNANDRLRAGIAAEFLKSGRMSEDKWREIEDRVVILHDNIEPEEAKDMLAEWVDDEDVLEEIQAPTRGVVEAVNVRLPSDRRFHPLGSVDAPVAADLYLAPE